MIGSAAASAEGDFAIVLDKPLEPGDYQISLRSTGPGEAVANSAETAIVSVPENAGGEVLAMVEEPGKPAELISVPEAAEPGPTGAASRRRGDAATGRPPPTRRQRKRRRPLPGSSKEQVHPRRQSRRCSLPQRHRR